jgi:hypothetical protein
VPALDALCICVCDVQAIALLSLLSETISVQTSEGFVHLYRVQRLPGDAPAFELPPYGVRSVVCCCH